MASLPTPGGDVGTWGGQLNTFLEVSLNSDGTINPAALPSMGSVMYGDGSDGPLVVPASSRTVTDLMLNFGSTTATSATANFTSADVGVMLDDQTYGMGLLLYGTRILAVNSSTSITMSLPPTAGVQSGVTLVPDVCIIGQGWLTPGLYSSITIDSGATAFIPAEIHGQVLCSGTYTIDGTLDLSGATTAAAAGFEYSPSTGPGVDSAWPYGAQFGGNGGNGAGNLGGASYPTKQGSSGTPFNAYRSPFSMLPIASETFRAPGGAGGGGDGTNFGGGGGIGGSVVLIMAKAVVHGGSAVYLLTGQAGQAGGLAQSAQLFSGTGGPAFPYTVTSGSNNEFVYTPASTGTPETFTVAAGTYNTLPWLVHALNAATGSAHGEAFSTICTVDRNLTVTTVTGGTTHNSDTITAGANDIANDMGWVGQSFAGGADSGGNCGGGGGGSDGWWLTVSDTLTGSPTVTGGGGAGGAGIGTGTAGTSGGVGFGAHYLPGSVIVQNA